MMLSIILSFFSVCVLFCAQEPEHFLASYTQAMQIKPVSLDDNRVAITDKKHFLEGSDGRGVTCLTSDMLYGVVMHALQKKKPMFYSVVCDKILCDILRHKNIIEPSDTVRLWILSKRPQGFESREGLVIMRVPGTDYDLRGIVDDRTRWFHDFQGLTLNRAKAAEQCGVGVATFDDNGPTNYWMMPAGFSPVFCACEVEDFYVLFTHTIKAKLSRQQDNEGSIADKKHFLEDRFRCVVKRATHDMLRDVIERMQEVEALRKKPIEHYSVVCDKIFCDVLRQEGIKEPAGVVRRWFLRKRDEPSDSCEGFARMRVPDADEDICGLIAEDKDASTFSLDIQGYTLDREKARERAVTYPHFATFDALGPTNYWMVPDSVLGVHACVTTRVL